ncbi:hypothetical protein DOV13_22970 [Salmonella enterica]|nr:hypothetical protein [Salmonella enterica]
MKTSAGVTFQITVLFCSFLSAYCAVGGTPDRLHLGGALGDGPYVTGQTGGGSGYANSQIGLPLAGGSGAVTATFRVSDPGAALYNTWSVTGGSGYHPDRPAVLADGPGSAVVGYYLAGGQPAVLTNIGSGTGARIVSYTGTGGIAELVINLTPVDPRDTYYGPASDDGVPGAGWVAHSGDKRSYLLASVSVLPNKMGPGDMRDNCFAGGGGPGTSETFSNFILGPGGGSSYIGQYTESLMGITPGSASDHGASLLIYQGNYGRLPLGAYTCSGHPLTVTLTPTLVGRGAWIQQASSNAGLSDTGATSDWSPAGAYTLNLRATILYS